MRALAIAVGCLLTGGAVTFAATGPGAGRSDRLAALPAGPPSLVVPDVRGQAYVFAKGTLEDAGFAWRVSGRVRGYAVNLVEAQAPAPGTRLVDTGAPTVTLRLARNPIYPQQGEPEDHSLRRGTGIQEAGRAAR
ncbi:MAG: PASTA domain-containing protein [Gaiellaceae bacterium]